MVSIGKTENNVRVSFSLSILKPKYFVVNLFWGNGIVYGKNIDKYLTPLFFKNALMDFVKICSLKDLHLGYERHLVAQKIYIKTSRKLLLVEAFMQSITKYLCEATCLTKLRQ